MLYLEKGTKLKQGNTIAGHHRGCAESVVSRYRHEHAMCDRSFYYIETRKTRLLFESIALVPDA